MNDTDLERVLPRYLESAYQLYVSVLPPADAPAPRMVSYIFGTRPEWEQFTRRNFPRSFPVYRRIQQGGFTEGGTSVSFYTNRSATLATLAHEGWHQYVATRISGRMPAWLNEGLACYCEYAYFDGDRPVFTPQKNSFRVNSLRAAIRSDRLFTVRELVNIDAGAVISRDHSTMTHTYYAQCWALVTLLKHGRHRSAFEAMLRDLREGTFEARVSAAGLTTGTDVALTPGEAAYLAYFGCTPDDMKEEYYDHMVRLVAY